MPNSGSAPNAAEASSVVHMHDEPRAKKFQTSKGEGLWLMSFGDLCLILISFFILLLSYSTISQKKADVMREAVQAKTKEATKAKDSLTQVSQRIENEIKRLKLDKNAEIKFDDAGIAIEFKDGLLFAVGSANSNPQFQEVISQVMRMIATTPEKYQLKIEGHTDDIPVRGGSFASNWELSSARGIALMRQFAQKGVKEERMSVVAYAHTKPKRPIEGLKGDDLTRARAANRRVVIRIEPL